MKGLSIEEKAKRYDEAIERAKSKIKNDKDHVLYEDDIIEIFPEFKESEDERIIKAIKSAVLQLTDIYLQKKYGLKQSDCIAWLEKKGEQKPTLPKWKYKNDITPLLRDSLILNKYGCVCKSPSGALVSDVWVIDYDELAKLPKEEFEKQSEQKPAHFELKAGHWYICHRAFCCRADHLTVKEGERFMCEKDGIVKGFVMKDPEKYFKEVCAPAPMEDEQNPAWSEEDRKIIIELIGIFGSAVDGEHVAFPYRLLKDYIRVLKSCLHQSTWKPRKSQIEALALATIPDVHMKYQEALKELYEDLNKLKNGEITNN